MKFLSKVNVSVLFLLSILAFVYVQYFANIGDVYDSCLINSSDLDFCLKPWLLTRDISFLVMIFLSPVVLTLPLKATVFFTWSRFAIWAIPMVLIVYLFVENTYDGFNANIMSVLVTIPTFIAYFTSSFVVMYKTWRHDNSNPKRIVSSGLLLGVGLAVFTMIGMLFLI